jgi:hypothetical protein
MLSSQLWIKAKNIQSGFKDFFGKTKRITIFKSLILNDLKIVILLMLEHRSRARRHDNVGC